MPPVTLMPLVTFTSPPAKTLNDSRVLCVWLSGGNGPLVGRICPATDSPPGPVTFTLPPVDALKTPVPEIASESVLSAAEGPATCAIPPAMFAPLVIFGVTARQRR